MEAVASTGAGALTSRCPYAASAATTDAKLTSDAILCVSLLYLSIRGIQAPGIDQFESELH